MAQKRVCESQKLRCNICKRSCNIISRNTYRNDLPIPSSVEAVQELHKVLQQVMYKKIYLHSWGISGETVLLMRSNGRTQFHMVELGRKLFMLCVVAVQNAISFCQLLQVHGRLKFWEYVQIHMDMYTSSINEYSINDK